MLNKRSFRQLTVAMLVTTTFGCVVNTSHAVLVFSHTGSTDPTTEGWTETAPPTPGVTAFSVTNDAGSGIDAWAIDDNSVASGSRLNYRQIPTATQHSQAAQYGWTLSTNLRVVDDSNPGGSVQLDYGNGSKVWGMVFSVGAGGDPSVVLATGFSGSSFTGPTFTLEDAGSTYNTWELKFDADLGSADLFVNGVEKLSNYTGFLLASIDRVLWGGNSVGDVGQGNWNSVQWDISAVPEPNAFFFVGLVAGVTASASWLKRWWNKASCPAATAI